MPWRPPALAVVSEEVLDQLYVKTRSSSRRKYSGQPYECAMCRAEVSSQSPNEHWRVAHQSKVTIRFGDKEHEVKRSRSTNLFECPRCSSLFKHPRHLQDHALAWRGACPVSNRSVDSPMKMSQLSASTSSTPQGVQMRRRRAPQVPQTAQNPKSVARPLKTPTRTRTGVPDISRTFRAMIRQCYNQCTMSNKEIAEYCNCDVRDVYFAINNESGDNLDEDQDYLDGKLGDIVNIDDVDESLLAYHYDEKFDVDEAMSESSGESQIQQQQLTQEEDPRAKAYPTPESDPPYDPPQREPVEGDAQYDSEEEVERILAELDLNALSDREVDINEPTTHRPTSSQDVFMAEPPAQVRQHRAPLHNTPPDPVYTFFSSLPKTLPLEVQQMARIFKVYGVNNSQDLDTLSEMEPYWPEVENYVCSQGLSRGQWLRVCVALRARRAAILRQR